MITQKRLGLLLGCALAASALAAACDGGEGSLMGRPPIDPLATEPIPAGTEIGEPALRRLTAREWETTVRDVFGLGADWKGPSLSADRASEQGFDNDAVLLEMDESKHDELVGAAESLADTLVAAGVPAKLAPACRTAGRECTAALVDGPGQRLFRRPLETEERNRYLDVFDQVSAKTSPPAGVRWTLVSLLSSPSFLYRSELGKPAGNGRVVLNGDEIASALSYTFSGGPPSEELIARGRRGELSSPEARVAEAKKLLEGPRGHEVLALFARQWLHYEDVRSIAKDEAVVPGFSQVRQDMAEETRTVLDELLFEKKGTVRDLFSSKATFLTPALATHYGLTGTGKAERPQAIGILAHGSILSRYALPQASSPSQRGAFVREKLLCQPLPPPPPNVGEPPVPQPGLTTRELYEKIHAASASCAGCHAAIDPIGFGLEHFDLAGRFRTTERGKPIDASGKIAGAPGAPTFSDHEGLARILAASPEVAKCIGGLLATYAFGTEHGKEYTLAGARDDLAASRASLVDFYARLAAAPHFAVRKEK
jgi:hypothetical protein